MKLGKIIYRELTENVFLYILNELVQSLIYNSPFISQSEYVIYMYTVCTPFIYYVQFMIYVRSGKRVENFRVERKEASRRVFPHLYYKLLYIYICKEARKREKEII